MKRNQIFTNRNLFFYVPYFIFTFVLNACMHRSSLRSYFQTFNRLLRRLSKPGPCFIVCAYGKLMRGSRINTDRFPERAPKAQASRGVRGHGPHGKCFRFYLPKVPFPGFPSSLDRILASSIHLGWSFARWKVFYSLKIYLLRKI